MFDLPNPVGMYEQAKMAGLEREVVEEILSGLYSDYFTTRWNLRKLPLIGPSLAAGVLAHYVSLKNSKLFGEGKIRITVPKSMLDPDLLAEYETEYINKS